MKTIVDLLYELVELLLIFSTVFISIYGLPLGVIWGIKTFT